MARHDPALSPFNTASRDVMQTWSAADPESSWQWLASTPTHQDGWLGAAEGYVEGLDHPDWQGLLGKAGTLPAGEPGETSARNRLRYEVAMAWGHEDPLAALASYGPYSSGPNENPRPMASANSAEETQITNLVTLVDRWINRDPGVAAKLQAWEPADQDRDKIFGSVALSSSMREETRQQVRSLIRDPQTAARVDAQIEDARPSFLNTAFFPSLDQAASGGRR